MCGIFGIVWDGVNPELGKILIKAGRRLVYRGYDSVGCATIDGDIDLRKDVGTIEEVAKKYDFQSMKGSKGIIQLRWATFGRPSKKNAQPHIDCRENMVGAHNGNIVNTTQLRDRFIRDGHKVKGWNDGEMVVHAVEEKYNGSDSMLQAIQEAHDELHGDYAYAVTTKDEDHMYAVKSGSSLYLGIGKEFICCSSDLPSILPFTDKIVTLMDGEMVRFDSKEYSIYGIESGGELKREAEICDLTAKDASKGGFDHYMLKEIHEQPSRLKALINVLDESKFLDSFIDAMEDENVYLVASGSSFNACVMGAYYLNRNARVNAIPVIAGQFIDLYGAVIDKDTPILCVSQSGETKDVINVVNHCKKMGKGRILGVLNVLGSTLMLNSQVYLPLSCDLEISVPATKTYMNQVVLFFYLSLKIAEKKNFVEPHTLNRLWDELHELPSKLERAISESDETCRKIAGDLSKSKIKDIYCLGYGLCHGTALEGALKIKEVTYAHCEGMYSSEFKHGPLSIIQKGYPVIFVAVPEDARMVISHMNEITCRKGSIIAIAPDSMAFRKNSDEFIPLPPAHGDIAPILGVVPLQLIAYHWAVSVGNNPDLPRNLSKTLTVD